MKTQPKVSIIILNWNGLNNTRVCLDSLKKIRYQNFEVILIENDSKEPEGEMLMNEYGDFITLIQNSQNTGYAEGNNIGICEALQRKAKYVLLLNNDTSVQENFLDRLVETAEHDETFGMVAPTMLKMSDNKTIDNLGLTVTLSGIPFNRMNERQTLFCPSGGAVLYSTKLLQAVQENGFYLDPYYFAYAEDYDLGFRALLKGFKPAYAKGSIVYHKGSASTSPMSDFAIFQTQRNTLMSIFKNSPWQFLLKNSIWIISVQLGIFFLYIKRKKVKLILSANHQFIKKIPSLLAQRRVIQNNKKVSSSELGKFFEKKIVVWEYLNGPKQQ